MAMNPNVNMANMNPMGGPVGGAPVPMMNNGQAQAHAQAQAAAAANARQQQQQQVTDQRGALNTYIYEYFIRQGMYDCARSLLQSDQPVNVNKEGTKGGPVNGVGDDSMDQDSKSDLDTKLPDDLPPPKLPMSSDSSFLYEWFCLFWDIYNAQRSKGGNGNIVQYVAHTQQQSRLKQNQQQELLRNLRTDNMAQYQQMMRLQQNGAMNMQMKQGNLARAAMANNQNNPMMIQQAQAQQQQAKQNQMQRDPSSMDGNRDRPSSPANGENAPSPSKRQRVDNAPFNPNQPGGMMPNGRPGPNMPPQQMPGGPAAAQMLSAHGINPGPLGQPQFNNFVNIPPTTQQKSIATYSQHLQHHHGNQMGNKQMPNAGGPQGQGSPMMAQGPDGNAMNYTYNPAGEMAPGGLRPGAPGAAQAAAGSNHALQDYQMQLMLLEQQNKKRLMMARQEQDNIGGMPREGQQPGPGGPGVPPGPNGQGFPEASPQAIRAGASPNPTEQMKRGTPQMNNSGIPSPVPEGGPQSRESPNPAMNFMGNADPNVAPHFFNKGADGSMVPAGMNGMRPPSSHPGPQQPFNPQMNHQMMVARQAAAQQGQNPQQWQQPPNGQMMPGGMQQSPQIQGTPQQRPMAPPSAPAANNTNNRTTASPQQAAAAPPTPSQTNKAAPKGKKKGEAAKDKRAAQQKKTQNVNNASATPAAESTNDADSAAPATPITPVNPSFKNGQSGAGPNSQPNASAAPPQTAVPAPQPPVAQPQGHDPSQNGGLNMDNFNMGFDHMDMSNGLQTGDMLNDFDFDSFLNDNDNENQPFDFNGAFSVEEGIDTSQ